MTRRVDRPGVGTRGADAGHRMRLLGSVVLAGAALATATQAQMTIGAKGGLNFATASLTVSNTGLSPGTRSSYHGGAVIGMQVGSGFAIEGQVRFVGKGFDPGATGSGVANGLAMDYFEFPLLATLTFPRDPTLLAARVFAGPSVGIRASCNLGDQIDQTGFTDCDGDLSKTFDFSAVVGAGIKIGRGLGGIVVDVSYDYGLLDITAAGQDASVRNRNLLVSAGFIVPII